MWTFFLRHTVDAGRTDGFIFSLMHTDANKQ